MYKRVEWDARLYGRGQAIRLVGLFVVWVVFFLSAMNDVVQIKKIEPRDIVNWDISQKDDSLKTQKNDTDIERLWSIVAQFADPGNLPSAHGVLGRIVALICAIGGIVLLAGMMVSSIVNFISTKSKKWSHGLIDYNKIFNWSYRFKDYVVIIGVNEQTASIVKSALKRENVNYVVIQTRQKISAVRSKLELALDKKEEEKVVFYFGERTSKEDVYALSLTKALSVFVLGESMTIENEKDHDAYNIACMELIADYMHENGKREKKKCYVDLGYQSTFTAFKSTSIYSTLDKNVEFIPFNVHEMWAKKVLVDNFAVVPDGKNSYAVQKYQPIDTWLDVEDNKVKGITASSDKTVRVIIMGMNQMGTALGLQTALMAHYPNFYRNNALRTTITFIDEHAKEEGEFFRGRFASMFDLCRYRIVDCEKDDLSKVDFIDPMLDGRYKYLGDNFMDIQWEFIQGNVASEKVQKYISDVCKDENNVTTVAVCFNHPQQSIATALYLPEKVFKRAKQILVYQQDSFDLINKVACGEKKWKRYDKLKPFGMVESSYSEGMLDNQLAKLAYFLYYDRKKTENASENSHCRTDNNFLTSFSSSHKVDWTLSEEISHFWNGLEIVEKLVYIDQVDCYDAKLRSMGIFTIEEINEDSLGKINDSYAELNGKEKYLELMAKSEHSRWLTQKLASNYRPLTEKERQEIINPKSKKEREHGKKYWIEKNRAHLDMCSYSDLLKYDAKSASNYYWVVLGMPFLMTCNQFLNLRSLVWKNSSLRSQLLRKLLTYEKNGNKCFALSKISKRDCENILFMDAPITQEQWTMIMGGENNPTPKECLGIDKPVVQVSKDDVDLYVAVLNKLTGLKFDLPTKNEWKAAADTVTRNYVQISSNKLEDENEKEDEICKQLVRFSNFLCKNKLLNSKKQLMPVRAKFDSEGQKQHQDKSYTNPIFDMLGNVWEWTKTDEKSDSKGKSSCYYFCGGSWKFGHKECDLRDEYWNSFWLSRFKSDDLGFRLVLRINDYFLKECKLADLCKELNRMTFEEAYSSIKVEDRIKQWLDNHMVDVDGGYFIMGTETPNTAEQTPSYPKKWVDDTAGDEETPHHFVKISKFKIASVPVTQSLWNAVMGKNEMQNRSEVIGAEKPQTNVSWLDIQEFLRKLNAITGEKYRLPTEAEWEFVAKEGATTEVASILATCFGETGKQPEEIHNEIYSQLAKDDKLRYRKYSGSDNVDDVAWIDSTSIHDVALKKKNQLGVYDMSGNVWEWVQDYYQIDFYKHCMKGDTDDTLIYGDEYKANGYMTDPVCENSAYTSHVFRGGAWSFGEDYCRCTSANFWVDTDRDNDLGFRLALDVKE